MTFLPSVRPQENLRDQYLHDAFRVLFYVFVQVAAINESEVNRCAQEVFPLDRRRILQNLGYFGSFPKTLGTAPHAFTRWESL